MRTLRAFCLGVVLVMGCVATAQRQYWGVTNNSGSTPDSPVPNGGIIRVDSLAMNAEVVLAFDPVELAAPNLGCGLMQASNGLIYFMNGDAFPPYLVRILALDPVTDTVRVVSTLGGADFPSTGQRPFSSMVEASPGMLVDVTIGLLNNARALRFDIANESLMPIATIPTYFSPGGEASWPTLTGTLCVASTGKLYGSETGTPNVIQKMGAIDPDLNQYTAVPHYDPYAGYPVNGGMVQVGNKLYGTTLTGGVDYNSFFDQGNGVICSYDITTNTYQKELDLNSTIHNPYRGNIAHANGLLYGEAYGDSIPLPGMADYWCIYAYNPALNSIERVVSYGQPGLGIDITGTALQPGLLAASNGKIYGSFQKGLFEYEPATDTVLLRTPLIHQPFGGDGSVGYGLTSPLIEICRKPNYKPRPTTSFNVCAGAYFAYDLRNVNATSVVWRRNGSVVPSQTNQRLEFTAITEGDEGVWTCMLTNECGVTEPPAITITVNTDAFTTSTISGGNILCGNGDSVVLTGNNGGTWSGGATTPTLTVTQPGQYLVYNQQACGLSMSNIITITPLDSAVVPPSVNNNNFLPLPVCPGETWALNSNEAGPWGIYTPGVWSTGEPGPSITVQDTGFYYLTVTNACNTDTSNIWHLQYHPVPAPNEILITDAIGDPADLYLCGADSVTLSVVNPSQGTNYNWLLPDFSTVYGATTITTATPGNYVLSGNGICLPNELAFTINADDVPPQDTPIILPNQELLSGCDQDSVYLLASQQPTYWTWTDGVGVLQRDTSEAVLVDWEATGYSLVSFNGCGEGPQDFIFIQGTPAPDVQYTDALDTLCLTANAFALSAGTPAGGTYSGPGVNANTFNPATAGIGQHTITYSYSDGNCTGFAQAVLVVDVCTGVAEMHDAGGITVSPNPNDGAFQVYIERIFKVGTLTLFDARGKRVGNTTRLAPGSNAITQTDLAPGVYQVRLEIDGKVEQRSVVITRE